MERSLTAVIAVRNKGSRLFGKPLQNLDIENGISILDFILRTLSRLRSIRSIVLAISEGPENRVFIELAAKYGLQFIIGDETDVLRRLIDGLLLSRSTDLFRITSESPFLYWNPVDDAWQEHVRGSFDASFCDNIIDGCGFEIISLDALKASWVNGTARHRSELCSLYIRENLNSFKTRKFHPPALLHRTDLRLTVDYPEDLVVCRAVYNFLQQNNKLDSFDLLEVVDFLDANSVYKSLVSCYTEEGYSTMYV